MLIRKKIAVLVALFTLAFTLLPYGKVSAATSGCDQKCACSSLAAGAFRAVYNTTGDAALASTVGVVQYYACMAN